MVVIIISIASFEESYMIFHICLGDPLLEGNLRCEAFLCQMTCFVIVDEEEIQWDSVFSSPSVGRVAIKT